MSITENIAALMTAVQEKFSNVPSLEYAVENVRRPGQTIGGRIVVRHQDHPDFSAGVLWVGSAVNDSGGRSRKVVPKEVLDNLLEVKAVVGVAPKYMFRWLEQGAAMEVTFRQAKPGAKVRVENLADQIHKWAHVLMSVTPEYVVESEDRARLQAERAAAEAEEARRQAVRQQMEEARREARERVKTQITEGLLRDYPEVLYNSSGGYYEDEVQRAQRVRVQSQAGFLLKTETRSLNSELTDARPWFELDGSYCKPFSEGEVRAMLDALKLYRSTTDQAEWLPQAPTGDEDDEIEIPAEFDEDGEPQEVELDASILLAVPLPDSMD